MAKAVIAFAVTGIVTITVLTALDACFPRAGAQLPDYRPDLDVPAEVVDCTTDADCAEKHGRDY